MSCRRILAIPKDLVSLWKALVTLSGGNGVPSGPPSWTKGRSPTDCVLFLSGGTGKWYCILTLFPPITMRLINERRKILLKVKSVSSKRLRKFEHRAGTDMKHIPTYTLRPSPGKRGAQGTFAYLVLACSLKLSPRASATARANSGVFIWVSTSMICISGSRFFLSSSMKALSETGS